MNKIICYMDIIKSIRNRIKTPSSWIAIAISAVALSLSTYQFYFHTRSYDDVTVSAVGVYQYSYSTKYDFGCDAFVLNNGTNPVAIYKVRWILSEKSDPYADNQRKYVMGRDYNPPIMVKEKEVCSIHIELSPDNNDIDKLHDIAELFYNGVPNELRLHNNFAVQLNSNIIVYCIDKYGNIHRANLKAGDIGYRPQPRYNENADGSADVDNIIEDWNVQTSFVQIPITARLLPSPPIYPTNPGWDDLPGTAISHDPPDTTTWLPMSDSAKKALARIFRPLE